MKYMLWKTEEKLVLIMAEKTSLNYCIVVCLSFQIIEKIEHSLSLKEWLSQNLQWEIVFGSVRNRWCAQVRNNI